MGCSRNSDRRKESHRCSVDLRKGERGEREREQTKEKQTIRLSAPAVGNVCHCKLRTFQSVMRVSPPELVKLLQNAVVAMILITVYPFMQFY